MIDVNGRQRLLPPGWEWVKLSDVVTAVRGVTFKQHDARQAPAEGYIPILRAGNIGANLNTVDDLVWVPADLVSEEQKLRANDIVMCLSSGSANVVGKSAKLSDPWFGSVGAFCAIIRYRAPETADYLSHWFRGQDFLSWRDSQARGANIQNLRVSELLNLDLPLPPLAEQKRIVAVLNQQMAAVERAKKASQERLEAAQALRAALLQAVLPSRNDSLLSSWQWVSLGEIAAFQAGGTPSKSASEFWSGDIPFLTGADVTDLYLGPTNARAKLTENGLLSGKTAVCKPNSILLVTRTRVGRAGLAQTTMGASQDITVVEPNAHVDPEYLCRYLLRISDVLVASCRGSTIQGLTREVVKGIPIPLPPLAEQKRIVAAIKMQIATVESGTNAVETQLAEIESMPSTLLRRAFSGEI